MAPLTHASDFRVMVPLLVIFFAGELVWRERDSGLSENVDATPVPEWVFLLGKFLGLGLVLGALILSMSAAGIVAQRILGQEELEVGLYLKFMFGLQLPEYLLFAMLALFVLVIANQKHVAMLVALTAYIFMVLPAVLGKFLPFSAGAALEHNLAIYSAGPAWSYSDMRGFGGSLQAWLWFKLYWAAWGLLLAIGARLLWGEAGNPGSAPDSASPGSGSVAAPLGSPP